MSNVSIKAIDRVVFDSRPTRSKNALSRLNTERHEFLSTPTDNTSQNVNFGVIMIKKKIFYNPARLFSHSWAFLYVMIGARRRGKSYGAYKKFLNSNIYHKEQFVILRDTQTECEEIEKDNGDRLFGEVLNEPKYKRHIKKMEIKSGTIYFNDEIAGFIMPASLFRRFKGTQYNKVKIGLYDEFIPENNTRYNGDRAWQFINSLMSVCSLRKDFKMILTANALNTADTILTDLLGFNIKSGQFGIYKNKAKGVVLEYIPNSQDFIQYQQESNVFKLIKGTRYESNLLDNKFLNNPDEDMFFTKKGKSDLYGIYYHKDGFAVRLYEGQNGDVWYCTQDTNKNSVNYMRFTFDIKQVTNKIRLAENDEKKKLQFLFKNNLIKFENSYILKMFKEIIL